MPDLVCWRCGASLKDLPQPITRLIQCTACSADLHVCKLCRYYNPRLHQKCDHDMAEPAREIDIANFCDYFTPRPDAYQPLEASKTDAARAQLEALFGGDEEAGADEKDAQQSAKDKFDSLFKD